MAGCSPTSCSALLYYIGSEIHFRRGGRTLDQLDDSQDIRLVVVALAGSDLLTVGRLQVPIPKTLIILPVFVFHIFFLLCNRAKNSCASITI